MLDEKDLFGEETRVAKVDPGTGIDLDGTRITRGAIPLSAERRTTAQFLPNTGMRETGEITSMWTSSPPIRVQAASRLRFLSDRIISGRIRLFIAIAAAVSISVALVAVFAGRRAPSRSVDEAIDSTGGEHEPEKQAASIDPAPIGKYSASLGEAVSDLLDGHLEEALGHYEALLRLEPTDESVEQAVGILRRRIGGGGQ